MNDIKPEDVLIAGSGSHGGFPPLEEFEQNDEAEPCQAADYNPNDVEEARRWGNNKGHRSKTKRKTVARIVRASKKRNRK